MLVHGSAPRIEVTGRYRVPCLAASAILRWTGEELHLTTNAIPGEISRSPMVLLRSHVNPPRVIRLFGLPSSGPTLSLIGSLAVRPSHRQESNLRVRAPKARAQPPGIDAFQVSYLYGCPEQQASTLCVSQETVALENYHAHP